MTDETRTRIEALKAEITDLYSELEFPDLPIADPAYAERNRERIAKIRELQRQADELLYGKGDDNGAESNR